MTRDEGYIDEYLGIKKTGVIKIVFCKELAYRKQRRAAIPGLATGILYYDVERGAEHPMYHRSVIHHEYFHLIDYRDRMAARQAYQAAREQNDA